MIAVVQSLSRVFLIPWTAACQASQDRTLHRQQSLGKKAHVFPFHIMESFILSPLLLFSHSFVSSRPRGLQHTRLPYPPPTPGAYSNSCPLSQQCHRTISSSVISFSSCLQSFPSIKLFSSESLLHIRWPKYWNFSFSISPSNEYSGLISPRMDWLDLLTGQGTLNSLLQHHS